MSAWAPRSSAWRRDVLRTNLWLVPTVEIFGAVVLFAVTYAVDRAVERGDLVVPAWVDNGSPDGARQVLIGIAAAMITVVGVVFSVTIVALTLASTQFGPRIIRNFVRDRCTQITLGTFVATFVYTILALASVTTGARGDFVPHVSVTVDLALVLVSLGVLVWFIDHVTRAIQLPEVIASIARDLAVAVDAEVLGPDRDAGREAGPTVAELERRMDESGTAVPAPQTGYLQYMAYDDLVGIAGEAGAVVRLLYRPGHFVVEGLPLATVWPADAEPAVARSLARAQLCGPHRTLAQDLSFAIDQLVEIAIRALSPAVNDTFTALTCVDWLSDGLHKITVRWDPAPAQRDAEGNVRIIPAAPSYERLVGRAFDKIRQAAAGMPAVMIRQLDAIARIVAEARTAAQRAALLEQAEMILRSCEATVPEAGDRADVRRRFDAVQRAAGASSNW